VCPPLLPALPAATYGKVPPRCTVRAAAGLSLAHGTASGEGKVNLAHPRYHTGPFIAPAITSRKTLDGPCPASNQRGVKSRSTDQGRRSSSRQRTHRPVSPLTQGSPLGGEERYIESVSGRCISTTASDRCAGDNRTKRYPGGLREVAASSRARRQRRKSPLMTPA